MSPIKNQALTVAYDKFLADRIRQSLNAKNVAYEEREMMGGWCAMVHDKMCVGIVKNELMARIDPQKYESALKRTGSRQMDFTGRPMRGFLFVNAEGIDSDQDLDHWVNLCLEFNPKAKSSKKKKK